MQWRVHHDVARMDVGTVTVQICDCGTMVPHRGAVDWGSVFVAGGIEVVVTVEVDEKPDQAGVAMLGGPVDGIRVVEDGVAEEGRAKRGKVAAGL